MPDQDAEVKVTLATDDSAAKQAEKLAASLKKAADQQERYNKAVAAGSQAARRGGTGRPGPEAPPKQGASIADLVERERDRQFRKGRLDSALVAEGLKAGPKPPRGPTAAPAPRTPSRRQRTVDEQVAEYRDRTRSKATLDAELVKQGLKKAPKPLAPPKTAAQKLQDQVSDFRQKQKGAALLDAELIKQGLKEPPEIKTPAPPKTLAEQVADRRAAIDHRRQVDAQLVASGHKAADPQSEASKSVKQIATERMAAAKREVAIKAEMGGGSWSHYEAGDRANAAADVATTTMNGGVVAGARSLGAKVFGARAAGIAGAVASAAHATLSNYADEQKTLSNPYLTQSQIAERNARGMPFGVGAIRGFFIDHARAVDGAYQAVGRENRRNDENEVHSHYRNRLSDLQSDTTPDLRTARLREAEYRGLNDFSRDGQMGASQATPRGRAVFENLHGPRRDPAIDRATVVGRKLFEEESRLLPARKELFFATKERIVAERSAAGATTDEADARQRLGLSTKALKDAASKRHLYENGNAYDAEGGAGRRQKLLVNEEDARRNMKQHEKLLQDSIKQSEAAGLGLAKSRAYESQSKVGVAQGSYENWKSREETASSQAQKFGSASATDIAGATNALSALRRHGWENLDPDSRSRVQQFYPDEARQHAEQSGERILKRLKPTLPDEFKDTLSDARRETTAAGKREEDAGYFAREAGTQGVAAALKDSMTKLTDAITKEVAAAISDIERKMNLMNNQIK